MPKSDGVLSTIGHTPLVLLSRLMPSAGIRLYAKLEAANPGGSIKDRPASLILEEALGSRAAGPGTVVIESSSGNMGIGLAQACRYHGLRFICVVDSRTSEQNLRVLRAYGAEIDLVTEPDPASELAGRIDFLFVATSTCGTIRGCAEYVRDHGLPTRLVAVDALGSQIFSSQRAKRLIPGMGAGLRPPLCDRSLIDEVVLVSDLECVVGCRRLVMREAILAGGSSGAVVAAVERIRESIPHGATCVVILPDRGERYLDTIYDDWVREHFGDVGHLWQCEKTS